MKNNVENLLREYASLNLHEVKDYNLFNNIAIVHHSSAIEGSTLTKTDSELLITEGITPKGKPLDHSLMVKDHFDALLYTLEIARSEKPLSVEHIRQINAKINKNTGGIVETALGTVDVSKGEFRKSNVKAGDHYFVNYDKVIPMTQTLIKEINDQTPKVQTNTEKLELSFAAHFQLVSIHPFIDGNGRTSRLLTNYIQMRFNLPLAVVFSEDKADYINALKETRASENMQYFYDFMYGQYQKYLTAEIEQANVLKEKNTLKKHRGISFVF